MGPDAADAGDGMTRVHLGPRQFAKLENWVSVPDGKHQSGGMQGHRRRWREQLSARRGHLTARQRGGETPAEDRWIDIDDDGREFIVSCIGSVKVGGWERSIRDIFDGCFAQDRAA
jgi:hypothetical protein